MSLYSHNGKPPAPLPHRIQLENGLTKTDSSTFTAEEISSNGYTGPYTIPTIDEATQIWRWDKDNLRYVVSDKPTPEEEVAFVPTTEQRWSDLREIRNSRLVICDWTRLDDSGLSDSKKAEWATYRQTLSDFPANVSDITDYTWPTSP